MAGSRDDLSRWEFLLGWVLIGVDRAEGRFSAGETPGGAMAVAVFTDEQTAAEALPIDVFEVRTISVRDLLLMMPPGYGVVVDAGGARPIALEASEVIELSRFTHPFPADTECRIELWSGLPDAARAALRDAVAAVEGSGRAWALTYTLDDSPVLGCLAFEDRDEETGRAVAEAIVETLGAVEAAGPVEGLGVATVNIVPLSEMPEALAAALPDAALL